MIFQVFSNFMIFPFMELFLVIFQVFHDFQTLWEPFYIEHVPYTEYHSAPLVIPLTKLEPTQLLVDMVPCDLLKVKARCLKVSSSGEGDGPEVTPEKQNGIAIRNEPRNEISNNLTSVDSDEPLQPPVKLRNSKWCSISKLIIIEYFSD